MEPELRTALKAEDMDTVSDLLKSGHLSRLPIDFVPDGATVLHVAAMLGYADCVHSLMSCENVNINAQDYAGWTPLMHAVANDQIAVVRVLLSNRNCNVNLWDQYQQTALHILSQAANESIAMTELLVTRGASLDLEDTEDSTAFLRAVEAHNYNIARLLYCHGCVTTTCTSSGRSALHMAAQQGQEASVQWLVHIGCNVNAPDNHFQTPLMLCVQQKKSPHLVFRIMKHLINAGAHLNMQDCSGNTVLLLSISNASVIKRHHIELLITSGADPNIPNRDGLTPIWQAVYDGAHYPDRLKIIQLLLQENCYLDMSCRGKLLFTSGLDSVFCYENYMSPLEVALDSGFHEAAKMLIYAGCQIKPDLRFDGEVPPELQWFQEILDTPQPLQQQCRLVVRRVLGESVQGKAQKLPLPERMIDYVLLQDLFH